MITMDPNNLDLVENRRRMLAGELYYAFTPDLMADRLRCKVACNAYNTQDAAGAPRRKLVELWKEYVLPLWAGAVTENLATHHSPPASSATKHPSHRRVAPKRKQSSAATPGSTVRSNSTTAPSARKPLALSHQPPFCPSSTNLSTYQLGTYLLIRAKTASAPAST